MKSGGVMTTRWNVVRRGHVLGQVFASEHAEATRVARDVYGPGARVSAPGDPSAPHRRPDTYTRTVLEAARAERDRADQGVRSVGSRRMDLDDAPGPDEL